MFDFYERRRIKRWLYSWPFLIVLIVASGSLLNGVWGVYQQERQTRINRNQRLTHLEELKIREGALKEEIDRLNTGRGIEEEIRQKFEVAKEGERVIVIVDPPENGPGFEVEEPKNQFEKFLGAIMFWR